MKLNVKLDEHIITVSYETRYHRGFVRFGEIRFSDTNFTKRKLDFCKENEVYNSQLNIIDFYENEKDYQEHQEQVIEAQTKLCCGND